jgi:hypothetical protein
MTTNFAATQARERAAKTLIHYIGYLAAHAGMKVDADVGGIVDDIIAAAQPPAGPESNTFTIEDAEQLAARLRESNPSQFEREFRARVFAAEDAAYQKFRGRLIEEWPVLRRQSIPTRDIKELLVVLGYAERVLSGLAAVGVPEALERIRALLRRINEEG